MKLKKSYLFLLGVLILIVLFLNFNSDIKNIDADKVEQLIQDENVFVLQAHEPYQGEIPRTDLILEDWENVRANENLLPEDKNKPILVYCRSGRMSSIVAEELLNLGYKDIYNFEGGMKAWEASGRKLIFN